MLTPLHQLAVDALRGHRPGSTHHTYTSDLDTEWTRYTVPSQGPILGITAHPHTHQRAIRAAHVHLYPRRGPRLRTRTERAITYLSQGDPCTTHLLLRAVQSLPRPSQEATFTQLIPDMGPEEIAQAIQRLDQMMEQQPIPPGTGCTHTRAAHPYSPGAVLEQRLIVQGISLSQASSTLAWSPSLLAGFLAGSQPGTANMSADLERLTAISAMGWDLMRLLSYRRHETAA